MKKITLLAQDLLLGESREVAVDFTCGQGFDTLFLAQHYQQVFAFDIQKEAIVQSKQKAEELNLKNIEFYQVSHDQFDTYVDHLDAGIFNLGYLPHGNPKITTQAPVVIAALEKACACLTTKGRMVVVCYPGFDQGKSESDQVEAWLSTLPSKQYDVVHISLVNRQKAPYICLIEKH